jgi:hypothetical protein
MRRSLLVLIVACGPTRATESAAPERDRVHAPAVSTSPTASSGSASSALAGKGSPACGGAAVEVAPGVVAERDRLSATPIAGEACLDLVRIDLARDRVHLFTAARDGGVRTLPGWRDELHLVAAINAGMFHDDGSPVGAMVIDGDTVAADNAKMSGYFAFDPRDPADPPAIIAGRNCQGFDLATLRSRYRSLVQSYRLLGCDGAAMPWADPKHYAAVAIGLDRAGHAVLLHTRAALTMTELARELATHELTGALFLEGGPEATVVAGDRVRVGSYETGFNENDDNDAPWKLPLVIGFASRASRASP